MKILVCGGRSYEDLWAIDYVLRTLEITHMVHGDAPGADRLCNAWALAHKIPTTAHPADWRCKGKSAGPIRNQEMLEKHPDIELCIAFPGGKGTDDMVKRARKAGIKVMQVLPRVPANGVETRMLED